MGRFLPEKTIAKIAVASSIAWWLGNLAGQPRPVFAALAPVLVIRSDPTATLRGSFGRVIGMLAGVGIGLAGLAIARPSPLLVGFVVAAALGVDKLITSLPRLGLDTKSQSAVSALILLFVANGVTNYAMARIWETAIGAGVGLIIDLSDGYVESKLTAGRQRRSSSSNSRIGEGTL
jgi:uncharacterized membrane protein YgaE (UPF0421/DUF939 family)